MKNINYCEYKHNRTRYESVFMHTKIPSATIQGNVTAIKYRNDVIMSDLLLHIRANLGMKLARDYASCHVARSTLVMLVSNTCKNLRLPAKCLDLNPYIDKLMDLFSFLFSFCRFCVVIWLFHPRLRHRRIFYPRFYPLHLFFYLNS